MDSTVTELLSRQIATTPDAVALIAPHRRLTYAEFDQRADVVARELRARQLGPGALVGIFLHRSVEAIVGMWGVLKAGAAYVPLEPLHPDHRVTTLLDQAGVELCLSSRRHRHRLDGFDLLEVITLTDLRPGNAPEARYPPARPEDLAYALHVPGSTGRSDRIEVEQRSLAAYLRWAPARYHLDAESRFALVSSLASDTAVTSIFPVLVSGGSVVVAPPHHDHVSLRDVLEGGTANAATLSPAQLDEVLRLGVRPRGLRSLLVGGGRLPTALASRARAAFGPQCRIITTYGHTETTVACLSHEFDPGADGPTDLVPIGTPGDGVGVALLSDEGRPVGHGEIGELHVLGDQVARGRVGAPCGERERFVSLPDGRRAYRTGDLAVQRPDGVYHLAGRTDHRLTIRGHLVEPAEVAAELEAHPAVRRAHVAKWKRPDRLAAYVVPAAEVSAEDLVFHLDQRLPRHMLPATVHFVPTFFRTPAGDHDVPRPGHTGSDDHVVRAVAEVWSTMLDVDPDDLRPDSDFVHLGGDLWALVEMIVRVALHVAGPERESVVTGLREFLAEPTFARACAAARSAGHR